MGTAALLLDAIGRERPFVTIISTLHPEGRHYELNMGDELGPEPLKILETLGGQAADMVKRSETEELGVADGRLLQDWVQQIMDTIFHTPIEPEVTAELSYPMRLACLETFTQVCWTSPDQQTKQAKPKRRTGAK